MDLAEKKNLPNYELTLLFMNRRNKTKSTIYIYLFDAFRAFKGYLLKTPYSSKIDVLLPKKGYLKLIYGINTVIKCGT